MSEIKEVKSRRAGGCPATACSAQRLRELEAEIAKLSEDVGTDTGLMLGLLKTRIRDARSAASITQEGLASACGVSRTQITNIESGKVGTTLEGLIRIALALGVTPNDLLSFPQNN